MEENYAEGDLGPIFASAVPLTLPVVSQLLRKRREGGEDSDKARALLQSCYEQTDIMQEACVSEQVSVALRALRLCLRTDGGGSVNAHLANLIIDAEGNAVFPTTEEAATPAAAGKGKLKEFEVVALSTLVPKSVEEALALIPSLYRYDPGDLHEAIAILEQ